MSGKRPFLNVRIKILDVFPLYFADSFMPLPQVPTHPPLGALFPL